VVAIGGFKKGDWALPEGGRLLRSLEQKSYSIRVAVGDGWTLELTRWHNGNGRRRSPRSPRPGPRGGRARAKLVAKRVKKKDDAVRMGFWHLASNAQRNVRAIEAPKWQDVRRNYAGVVAAQLERVMAVTPETVNAG